MEYRTSRSSVLRLAAAIAALAIAGYLMYALGVSRGREQTSAGLTGSRSSGDAPLKAGDVDPATGKRVLYWHDPMVPGQRFDRPGKSPTMDMQLVPVYEGGDADSGAVTVSARVQQNLGIRTAEVTRRSVTSNVVVAGNVAFNERDQVIVQTRSAAFVEALHVRATLDRVSKGQPLIDLYVPEWVAAQQEFLSLRRASGRDVADLVDAARQRLRQVGMTDEQIANVERRGTVAPRITLAAPIDGVVVELAAREGMTVMAGETLFRLNGLATVWVNAAVPEGQAAALRQGASVEARAPASPASVFRGSVQAILPDVDVATRTIRARIELANPERALAPGMFVNVTIGTSVADALVVPTEALIRTGTRTVVVVDEGSGGFRPADVEIGSEAEGTTEITGGLTAGQRIVVSGQFLLDSEASLRAATTRMQEAPSASPAPQEHAGEGRVTALGDATVTLSHGAIPTLQWPAMTMEFILPPGGRSDLRVDERVKFAFTMGDDGKPRLTRIEPTGAPQ